MKQKGAALAPAPLDGDPRRIREALEETRQRTWLLADGLDDECLTSAAVRYLSPPCWDLGHIANFEELWLVQTLLGRPELHPGDNDTYNAFEHPRHERPRLPLLDREGVREYLQRVRQVSLAGLERMAPRLGNDGEPLLQNGFVYWMLVLHEHQHQETLLQTIQMRRQAYTPQVTRPLPDPVGYTADPWCHVPAGPFPMGVPLASGTYDNEAPPHEREVAAFDIARYPVTNQEWLRFLERGGYEERSWWSARGRDWLDEEPHHAPLHWERRDGIWHRFSHGDGWQRVADRWDEVVCHVSYFEAEAFAAWRGARLPTEAEWEKACRWDPATGHVGRNPWGDALATADLANIDQFGWGPSRLGAHPQGAAPCGAQHMVGDVWEWTQSGFEAYPGFKAFPYDEYSRVFFGGDYRVLRGGSWATRAGCATGTFRNWDHPYRRQIFSGLRLARDA